MEYPASTNFSAAIANVSTAQICGSVGYTAAESAALRALSDIAGRYLLSIGRLAADNAASHNRTDSNLLDLVLSLETLRSTRGFSGGSDPTRPLLESVVLKELMAFVRIFDEIPFAKPILKERSNLPSSASRSFAQMGKEVPMAHVPRWLPCFPDSWEGWRREKAEHTIETTKEVVNGGLEGTVCSSFDLGLTLREERQRVRFRMLSRGKEKEFGNWRLIDDKKKYYLAKPFDHSVLR